jgi:hypothetical protein
MGLIFEERSSVTKEKLEEIVSVIFQGTIGPRDPKATVI